MGKMVSNCAAGRHVKHRGCFLLTMKMFKSHFHFQNTIKPPSRMTVLLPLPHLSPSHPPALSENQSLHLKLHCASLPLLQESNVVFRLITSSSSHFVDHCQQIKIKSQIFILCSFQKWRVSLRLVLLFAMWSHSFQLPLKTER